MRVDFSGCLRGKCERTWKCVGIEGKRDLGTKRDQRNLGHNNFWQFVCLWLCVYVCVPIFVLHSNSLLCFSFLLFRQLWSCLMVHVLYLCKYLANSKRTRKNQITRKDNVLLLHRGWNWIDFLMPVGCCTGLASTSSPVSIILNWIFWWSVLFLFNIRRTVTLSGSQTRFLVHFSAQIDTMPMTRLKLIDNTFCLSFLVEWSLLFRVSVYVCVCVCMCICTYLRWFFLLLKFPCFSSQYSIICVNIILSRSTLPRPHPRSSLRVYWLLLVCYLPRPLPTRQHFANDQIHLQLCSLYIMLKRISRFRFLCQCSIKP